MGRDRYALEGKEGKALSQYQLSPRPLPLTTHTRIHAIVFDDYQFALGPSAPAHHHLRAGSPVSSLLYVPLPVCCDVTPTGMNRFALPSQWRMIQQREGGGRSDRESGRSGKRGKVKDIERETGKKGEGESHCLARSLSSCFSPPNTHPAITIPLLFGLSVIS